MADRSAPNRTNRPGGGRSGGNDGSGGRGRGRGRNNNNNYQHSHQYRSTTPNRNHHHHPKNQHSHHRSAPTTQHANRDQQQKQPPPQPPMPMSGVPYGYLPAFLPGSASLVEQLDRRLMIVLRDGRHLVGVSLRYCTWLYLTLLYLEITSTHEPSIYHVRIDIEIVWSV